MTLNKKAQDYYKLKEKQAKELAEFTDKYCGFAFNDNQRQALLKKFKFNSWSELEENCTAFAGCGVILKNKSHDFQQLNAKHIAELHEQMTKDHEFAQKVFEIELANYECALSYRYDEALASIGFNNGYMSLREKGLEDSYAKAKVAYIDDMQMQGYI